MIKLSKIVFDRVAKQFQLARGGPPLTALDGLSLAIEDRSFVCLVGPSGCGKSTLLNLVAGFETPSRGSVTLEGQAISGPGPDRGMVFQEAALFPLADRDGQCLLWATTPRHTAFHLSAGCRSFARGSRPAPLL